MVLRICDTGTTLAPLRKLYRNHIESFDPKFWSIRPLNPLALSVPTELRIVFHVSKVNGEYRATMDSPDQNASNIPVTTIHFNYPDVKIEIASIGAVYEGTLSDKSIKGKWNQSGRSFELVLSKNEEMTSGK